MTRKGFTRAIALQIPAIVQAISGAQVEGLRVALELAFDIADAQIDTNPASILLRTRDNEIVECKKRVNKAKEEAESLEHESKLLNSNIVARTENRAAWESFQEVAAEIPKEYRDAPLRSKVWLEEQQHELRTANNENIRRHTQLLDKWKVYLELLDQAGLEGAAFLRSRCDELKAAKTSLETDGRDINAQLKHIRQQVRKVEGDRETAKTSMNRLERELAELVRLRPGYDLFRSVFGTVLPSDVDPEADVASARTEHGRASARLRSHQDEIAEATALRSGASTFISVFGDADPLTYDPIKEERKWRELESQAQQSAARLLEKVEALDNFEDLFPGQSTLQWLTEADRQRGVFQDSVRACGATKQSAEREISAIDRMSVVDDGHYEQAWNALADTGIPCERLGTVLLQSNLDEIATRAAMSAMSGLLAAPVFRSHQEMRQAAAILTRSNIAVPLMARDELLQALSSSIALGDGAHLAAFIGGPYSRQARILLEPDYAESEKTRLRTLISDCESRLLILQADLLGVATDGENYLLAIKARDAEKEKAREHYKVYSVQIRDANRKLDDLQQQTSESALAVLHDAKAFSKFGGDIRLAELEEMKIKVEEELRERLVPALAEAEARASHRNLTARADAEKYLACGGEARNELVRMQKDETDLRLAEYIAAIEDAQELLAQLENREHLLLQRAQDFEALNGSEQIRNFEIALEVDADLDAKTFMHGYARAVSDLSTREDTIRKALQVSFERAQTFRDNMGASDLEIETQLTQIAARLAQLRNEADLTNARIEAIESNERPALLRAARSIHELASAIGKISGKTRSAMEATRRDFPEIVFPVDVHIHYRSLDAIERRLRTGQLDDALVDQINEMTAILHTMGIEEQIRDYTEARKNMDDANKAFEDAKRSYCDAAKGQSTADETALNAMEIEEIERSDANRLQSLVDLFKNLEISIERDKAAAWKSKESAEAAHNAALDGLSRLIGTAQINLNTLDVVMARYPTGRFFVEAEIVPEDRIREILFDLKDQVARQYATTPTRREVSRADEGTIKAGLRSALIERVFLNPTVEFVNAAIWGGRREEISNKPSTGQKVALQFMWIVRQAEFEIERRLLEMKKSQAKKERATTNRLIIIDGIFSSLSNREIIKEAMSGLKGLGGNFQIIGLLHSETWVNDYDVFPIYHVGRKLEHKSGHKLISFSEDRADGTLAMFSSYARSVMPVQPEYIGSDE